MNEAQLTSLMSELVIAPLACSQKIIRTRTEYLGWIFNYFQAQTKIDVHQIIYKIKNLIKENPSVLHQSAFVKDGLRLINKLDQHAYRLLTKKPDPANKHILSLVFSFEKYLLTYVSNDQAIDVEMISLIKGRLNTINAMCYLLRSSFKQNIILATACCSYLYEHAFDISAYIKTHPEDAFHVLNASCLAKNDGIIQRSLESISHQNLQIFNTDDQSVLALDYLIDREEFCNTTFLVGDLQNPKKVLVSKEILSQRSTYFQTLFQSIFLEGSQSVILFKDMDHTATETSIDYQGFLCVLRYIYARKVDIPLELCSIVSHLADVYLEPSLKKICDQQMG